MTGEKIAGALGLCRRAGKITSGLYLVKEEVHSGKAKLVLLAEDAGKDAEKKLCALAESGQIPVHRIPLNKRELAKCIGKQGEAVCVAVPKEFVNLVLASI